MQNIVCVLQVWCHCELFSSTLGVRTSIISVLTGSVCSYVDMNSHAAGVTCWREPFSLLRLVIRVVDGVIGDIHPFTHSPSIVVMIFRVFTWIWSVCWHGHRSCVYMILVLQVFTWALTLSGVHLAWSIVLSDVNWYWTFNYNKHLS